jgi:uncharacterized protein (DUF427 family)
MNRQQRIAPGPGQESVWDYPRPPRVEDSASHIQVVFNGVTIAETRRAKRVLETSHPPVYYIPPQDVQIAAYLHTTEQATFCEWKGSAAYYSITVADRSAENVAWFYPNPSPAFATIRGYVAFYPGKMDACFVDGERVQAQPGDFYGGWITSRVAGPFKGEPGTRFW